MPACLRGLALLSALAWGLPGPAMAAGTPLQAEQEALQAYHQARQALAAARWDEAELLLERVLMLMPEHAEARLDFALLLARRGQPDAARALILGLAQDPRTPAAYAAQLQALAARLPGAGEAAADATSSAPSSATSSAGASRPRPTAADADTRTATGAAPAAPPKLWRAEATLAASTNPLTRTGAEGVVLTLPEGPVTLPLSTRPQPATVVGATLLRLQGSGGLDVSVQKMDRPATATAYRAVGWGPWPAQAWPAQAQRAGLGAPQWQLQTLRGYDNLRRHTAALALPLLPLGLSTQASQPPQGNPTAEEPAQALQGSARRVVLGAYAEPAQQDRGWLLRAEHRAGTPAPWPVQWQASLERSSSTARAQGYWRLNLAMEAPLGPGRRLQAQATAQEDTHPYSPLLENNSHRRLLTAYLGLEQQFPLGGGHALVLRAFTTQRLSNLALFAFRDTGAQVAFARQW